MPILVVVNNPRDWPIKIPGVEVVSSRSYLTDPRYATLRGAKVFNLCRSYRYQTLGYYVSLLAEARGQKPLPSISTIQDLKLTSVIRLASDEVDKTMQHSLAPIQSERFTLSIYFGKNVARRHERLSMQLFKMFPAPMLRADFIRSDRWYLHNINPISATEVYPEHLPFVVECAQEYLARSRPVQAHHRETRYDLAILYNPDEPGNPSNQRAIKRFTKAAENLGFWVDLIGKEDYGRIAEFDALFIRENTSVNHHTFRMARKAAAEGLVVLDDPDSILRCTNKVYLAELLKRHDIPQPETLVLHPHNIDEVADKIGYPCILKQPDSAFSLGVFKVDRYEEMAEKARSLLERSDLIIAQAYTPTEFDWRVGVLDRQALFVCRYYMAESHWQIAHRDKQGHTRWGKVEPVALADAPRQVLKIALRAASLIGDGLFGVDVKQAGGKFYVIEVNDNPNIDHGLEDAMLGDDLYRRVMACFLQRIEEKKKRKAGS